MMLNSSAFHIMIKPAGPLCNLDCRYCFYLEKEKLYPGSRQLAMSDRVLETYIRQYIQVQKTNEITFAWQGGEPALLGVDFFKKAVSLQKRYAGGKTLRNTFQTNGVLIDEAWSDFLSGNEFLVGVSIDGPADIHDRYRIMKGGQATFEKVMKGIECLKKSGAEFNTLTCITKANEDRPLDVYNFLKEAGSRYIQFIPVVERQAEASGENELKLVGPKYTKKALITEWSADPLKYGKFLSAVFDEWAQKDAGRIFVQMFDVALEAWYGQKPGLCVFSEVCGNAMAMEHNGDLYSCDHYVYPEFKLGNIMTDLLPAMVNSGRQMRFGLEKKLLLPAHCRKCEYLFACNGGCLKHRIGKAPDGGTGLNYLCSGYKHFFSHIDQAMCFMAGELKNGRPPANIVRWIKSR